MDSLQSLTEFSQDYDIQIYIIKGLLSHYIVSPYGILHSKKEYNSSK